MGATKKSGLVSAYLASFFLVALFWLIIQRPVTESQSRGGPHTKSCNFFSVYKQFYILAEVEAHPFKNTQILYFFIINIEGTMNQNVSIVITYF